MNTVIVLTSTFPRWKGDSEPPFVFELSRRLASSSRIVVLAPHYKGAKCKEMLSGIRVIRFRYFLECAETLCYQGGIIAKLKKNPLRYGLLPFFFFFQTLALYHLISRFKPAAIHAHWIIPQAFSSVLACYFVKQKPALICTSHGGDLYSLQGKVLSQLKKWILQKNNSITVVNSAMKTELVASGVDANCIEVIPMGVDLDHTFVANELLKKPFSLLFIGRLVEKKGLQYLLDALPQVIECYPQTKLTIIGQGPLEKSLKQQVINLNITDHVHFLGSIKNSLLPAYYQSHQLAVFPFIVASNGDREGLPVVITEAMGCSCNVLTTNLPGIEDLVTHQQNGMIVSQKSSLELSNAILYLFDHPDTADKLAKTASEQIRQLDWDLIAHKYQNVIQRTLTRKVRS